MIQKGIIAQVIDKYTYKIRIPKYDKIEAATASTKTDDLSEGIVCAMPGVDVSYVLGDIVLVSFENDELSKPIILGLLYREQKTDSDISLTNVDNSLSDIQNNLQKINSSGLYTHIRYSNDNGLTFTSLFSDSNHETIIDGEVVCQPLYDDTEVNGIKIDKATRVISWSIIDSNNADVTDEIGIEITVFDSNGNIIKKERNTDHQRSFTINNSSKITGDLYFTYKLYVTKQYLDTLSVMITTDKAPFGVPAGKYVGVYVSNNSRASINPSDYSWFQSSAVADIGTEINNKIARLSAEFDVKLENLKEEVDENFVTIYYKSVEWTQAEVDVYCQTGYEGIWSRGIGGYTGEVRTGNVLYITVHNTGTSSSSTDDSYGQLEIRALADASAGESVQGVVFSYLVSAEIAIDALARFKSSLLEEGDETLIYGGHIQTGTVDANQIHAGAITIGKIAPTDQEKILNSNVNTGINLINNSRHVTDIYNGGSFEPPYTNSTATALDYMRDGERYFVTSGGQGKYIQIDFPTLVIGAKYTISMDVAKSIESTGTHNAHILIDNDDYNTSLNLDTEGNKWFRIYATFVAESSTTYARFRFGSATNTASQSTYIRNIKLEQGEVTNTEWTPSFIDASRTATNYIVADASGLHVTDNTNNVGTSNENAVKIDSDSVDIVKSGQTVAEYSQGLTVWSDNGTEIVHLGYGTTQGKSGQTKSPYYDLGVRKANTTKGAYSVAEGENTTASGVSSHAEGDDTTASGWYSHAEGNETTASGTFSHAEGLLTTAKGRVQHVQGTYNVVDSNDTYLDIVGNGASDSNRSNAYALDWSGNGYYKGDVYVSCNANSRGGTKLIPFTKGTTSTGWIYIKYDDRTFEAWRTYETGSTALTNATNGAYSYSNWTSISVPNLSTYGSGTIATHVQATCRNGGRFASAYTSGTDVLFKVYACASVSTAQTYTVDLHIRGTWA